MGEDDGRPDLINRDPNSLNDNLMVNCQSRLISQKRFIEFS